MQQKFAAVCFYRSIPQAFYSYALEKLSIHSLCKRRHPLHALFFILVYRGLRSCPSLLENVSLHAPTRCVEDLPTFSVCISVKHSPSAPSVNAAGVVGKYIDIFQLKPVSFKHFSLPLLLDFPQPPYYLLVHFPFLMFLIFLRQGKNSSILIGF
jgi:hypothetical protein